MDESHFLSLPNAPNGHHRALRSSDKPRHLLDFSMVPMQTNTSSELCVDFRALTDITLVTAPRKLLHVCLAQLQCCLLECSKHSHTTPPCTTLGPSTPDSCFASTSSNRSLRETVSTRYGTSTNNSPTRAPNISSPMPTCRSATDELRSPRIVLLDCRRSDAIDLNCYASSSSTFCFMLN